MAPYLPPQKPHTGGPCTNMRKLMNGILYLVMTCYTWKDAPRKYGSKSTVNRSHLYLCEHGVYQKIFNELLNKGYDLNKIDLSYCFTDTKDFPAKKGKYRIQRPQKIKGIKISVLAYLQGLYLSIIIVPANKNDSTLYIPTLKNFNIKRPVGRPVNRPSKVTADTMYDTVKVRRYNRTR
jgi:transposase